MKQRAWLYLRDDCWSLVDPPDDWQQHEEAMREQKTTVGSRSIGRVVRDTEGYFEFIFYLKTTHASVDIICFRCLPDYLQFLKDYSTVLGVLPR